MTQLAARKTHDGSVVRTMCTLDEDYNQMVQQALVEHLAPEILAGQLLHTINPRWAQATGELLLAPSDAEGLRVYNDLLDEVYAYQGQEKPRGKYAAPTMNASLKSAAEIKVPFHGGLEIQAGQVLAGIQDDESFQRLVRQSGVGLRTHLGVELADHDPEKITLKADIESGPLKASLTMNGTTLEYASLEAAGYLTPHQAYQSMQNIFKAGAKNGRQKKSASPVKMTLSWQIPTKKKAQILRHLPEGTLRDFGSYALDHWTTIEVEPSEWMEKILKYPVRGRDSPAV